MATAPGGPQNVETRCGVRAVLALVVAAAAVALVLVAVRRWSPAPSSHEPAEIDTAHYLRPIETAADPQTGEETAAFAGFAVSVETEPSDALVFVAGAERGESPVLAGVECTPGSKVSIRAEKAGFRAAKATTICRPDTLVKLMVRLRR